MIVCRLRRLILCVCAATWLAMPSAAGAQDFGRNKVKYGHFDFQILETPHFDIYYYSREEAAAKEVARMAERWYERLTRILGIGLPGRQTVVLYANHAEFEQTNVVEGAIAEGTGGVTEGLARRVVLPLASSLGETDHVLGHELVHAFQYFALGNGAERMPLWFMEGMAEYLSIGNRSPLTAMWLRDAVAHDRVPTINDLNSPRFFPYRFGHAFWSYIGGQFGDEAIGRILRSAVRPEVDPSLSDAPQNVTADPVGMIEHVTGRTEAELDAEWHASIRALSEESTLPTPAVNGMRVIRSSDEPGTLSVGPSLSPDGRRLAFLSERSRLSIDLFVADATTGRVERQLTTTAADPHFDSLHFVDSAGSWAPDNKRLVIGAVHDGRPVLTVIDTETGRRAQEIPFPYGGEIFQPSWSPDGRQIAVVAQIGGNTDLYLYDFSTGGTRQLTSDLFADVQPAWSPDSRTLVFVTDRFGADLPGLVFRRYQLARLNVVDGTVTRIDAGVDGDVGSPQWATDNAIHFIGDATGRPELYRVSPDGGRAERVAAVYTGIAGITPQSPALSISKTGRTAYSVFDNSGYSIHVLDAPPAGLTRQTSADLSALPGGRQPSLVTQARTQVAPPAPTGGYPVRPYSPRLRLLDVSQQVGVTTSTSAFGNYVGGGISLFFSDELGDHLLSTGGSVTGGVKDISLQAAYINRTHRWNWGVFGDHVPLVSGSLRSGVTDVDGQTVYVEQAILSRQTFSEAGVLTAYPFSRSTRVEFSAAVQRVGFSDELVTNTFDATTGEVLDQQRTDLDSAPGLKLPKVGAALVHDATAYGPVGPVLGERYRFEISPTFGELRVLNVTADYRRYVMPFRPVTLAARVLHAGRYGGNGEDQRLIPFFLGYSTLVRGYGIEDLQNDGCTASSTDTCRNLDDFVGSRVLIANLEARVPLLGLFNGQIDYGPIPVELFGFFDAGVAWTRQLKPGFAGGTRPWARSVGVGVRVNLLGYAIGEFNVARANDRPTQPWNFVFNFRPSP